jgi:hypothetical protein
MLPFFIAVPYRLIAARPSGLLKATFFSSGVMNLAPIEWSIAETYQLPDDRGRKIP